MPFHLKGGGLNHDSYLLMFALMLGVDNYS